MVILPKSCLVTPYSLTPPLRKTADWIPTKHVLFPDFPERCAELFDAESINDGVDSGVAMSEKDGDVNEEFWLVKFRAEEGDAVYDVKWEPADCKEEKNQRQRLG